MYWTINGFSIVSNSIMQSLHILPNSFKSFKILSLSSVFMFYPVWLVG